MSNLDAESVIDDRAGDGVFRVHRKIFSDPELFDLEMRHIFERGWIFLALESQLPNPHDFLLTRIGRQPILLTRDAAGEIRAFYNTCPHRGASICSVERGNKPLHVCPYHSWSFDSAGRNRAIKGKSVGSYDPSFLSEDHDLIPIAGLESYRGLLFGSLTAPQAPLLEYLGEATGALDLLLDQSEDGIELVPGAANFTFNANWKQQLENCSDAYHVSSVHPTYMHVAKQRSVAPVANRAGVEGVWERSNMLSDEGTTDSTGGSFGFANGHVLAWVAAPVSPGHALYERSAELEAKFGASRRDWMFYVRNLTIFPNVQFAENFSSQLRIIRPISPNKTEMLTYCLAPIGESKAARRQRLRQYEDFFNPTGMATPDDIAVYEDCQDGHLIESDGWLQGYSRGMTAQDDAAMARASSIGLKPMAASVGTAQLGDETVFHTYYRAWRDQIRTGVAIDRQNGAVL